MVIFGLPIITAVLSVMGAGPLAIATTAWVVPIAAIFVLPDMMNQWKSGKTLSYHFGTILDPDKNYFLEKWKFTKKTMSDKNSESLKCCQVLQFIFFVIQKQVGQSRAIKPNLACWSLLSGPRTSFFQLNFVTKRVKMKYPKLFFVKWLPKRFF